MPDTGHPTASQARAMDVASISDSLDVVAGLARAIEHLSTATDVDAVQMVVRRTARDLTGADGTTIVLRDGDQCHYVDEDAIAPLWKGSRFPMEQCVSGWVMQHRQPAVIPDVYADDRVPAETYEPTFVRSMVMVPIRTVDPVGAIGAYWATPHEASPEQVELLLALASSTAVALDSVLRRGDLREASERNATLSRANLTLEHFASIVSHDLRAPLAHVHGLLDLLRTRPRQPLADDDRHLVDRALAHTANLLETTEALSDLSGSRPRSERIRDVDLHELVVEVIDGAGPLVEDADATIVHDALPMVRGDRALLRILLQNLVSNALKFRHADRSLVVTITAEVSDGHWQLVVTDTGRGIEPEDAERIFELFTRTTASTVRGGSGIGLATCRRIAEHHGGTIRAEALDRGTRFVVTIPSAPA